MTVECRTCSMNERCICIPSSDECCIRKESYSKAIENVKNLITERLKMECNFASCDDCEVCCEVSVLMWIETKLS